MNNTIFYTYIYYDPSRNNEPIYVGKGKEHRAWDHLTTLHRGKNHPLKNRILFMKKNGIKPIIGIYADLEEEFAHLLEIELIAKFGRKDLGKGSLLNLTDGGEGASGAVRSIETRARIGKANLGKDRTHTVSSKLKISKSCSGRKDSLETCKKKSVVNRRKTAKLTDNEVVEIFLSTESNKELSIKYNISYNQICGIKTQKYWKFLTESLYSTSEL